MIVDSHCHLDYQHLYEQLNEVFERAYKNNVKCFLTICTTLDSFDKIKLITNKYKNVYGTFGIHPHETSKFTHVNKDFILDKIKNSNRIIGIGETGLDFYYNYSDKKIQINSFHEHLNAASELKIPTIVHSRNAEKDIYEILKDKKKQFNSKILIHCFTGSKDFAKKLVDLNCFISVSGIITFNNSTELVDTISTIPLNNLLVETDSPYLSPIPFRGKKNEPSYIVETVKKLSAIKKVSVDKIMDATTKNFKNLFNIK